ncbi:MAG: phasin family protein [Alphaproteobacteria bacterium]|nr:phasin family protein [Alphaproteobacteria bacterium]
MMKSFEDMQAASKESFEAFTASGAALTKGYQAVAQEVADFSKKSFEKSAAQWEKAVAAKTFEKAVEVQQAFAKENFEATVAEFTKLGEIYAAAAKSAFKPFEASFAAFGVKAPVAK